MRFLDGVMTGVVFMFAIFGSVHILTKELEPGRIPAIMALCILWSMIVIWKENRT